MKRIAVIVIGSNSTRMLAADACDNLSNETRARIETQLFLGMTQNRLSESSMQYTVQSVVQLKKQAEETGAEVIGIFATSASRDALNAADFSRLVQLNTHLPLSVLSGAEEAAYAFFGAAPSGRCGVIDIGGGSTEVVTGCGLQIDASYSLQLGASRLFGVQPINSLKDAEKAVEIARQIANALPDHLKAHSGVDTFYLIGGTGTSCARIAGIRNEHTVLTRAAVSNIFSLVAKTKREDRCAIPGFPPSRIDILPTGIAVLLSVMDMLELDGVHVSNRVNADGILRAFVHKKFA